MAETLVLGACVSEIARRNDMAPSLLFAWRRQARGRTAVRDPVFLPVQVTTEPAASRVSAVAKRRRKAAGSIEIDLGFGRRLTVGTDVDAAALARVLDVLERR